MTAEANRGGWFHSGDRVVLEEGWFRFLDRIKDVIRRRGENSSAWDFEQVLDTIPGVLRSAVIPVPSEFGEARLARYAVPR